MQQNNTIKLNSDEKLSFPQGYMRLFDKIDELLSLKDCVVISIDGMCGGGKTFLSEVLEKRYDCNVFHADSFFLQQHQRSEKRLSEIGGNLDFERLRSEVLDLIEVGKDIEYHHFSCSSLSLDKTVCASFKKLNIVEGSYTQNPRLGFLFDLNVFICTSKETQQNRILNRNGLEKLQQFIDVWIPKENAYFEKFKIKENAHLVIET
ncbi:MAG: hypothetical protein R3Y32_07960 [Bacillota bacterium]